MNGKRKQKIECGTLLLAGISAVAAVVAVVIIADGGNTSNGS